MQWVSSRIWTRVAVFISYDDNNYTTGTVCVIVCGKEVWCQDFFYFDESFWGFRYPIVVLVFFMLELKKIEHGGLNLIHVYVSFLGLNRNKI